MTYGSWYSGSLAISNCLSRDGYFGGFAIKRLFGFLYGVILFYESFKESLDGLSGFYVCFLLHEAVTEAEI